MNVVIIDDNEMTRTLLRTILRGDRHDVVGEAASAKEGLALALKLKPDMIFLDIQMPDGSGTDLLKKITKELSETVVLMVTGKTDAQTQRECLAKGARGLIVKPFNAPGVLKAVHDAIQPANAKTRDLRDNTEATTRISWLYISNYKIATRLSVGFGVVTLLTILTGATGGWGLHSSSETTDSMVSQTLVKERLITEWRYDTALNGTRAMAVAKNADAAEQEALAPKIKETSSRISEIQKQLDGMSKSAAEAAAYDEIAKKRSDYIAARDEVFATKKGGNEDDAKKQTDAKLEPALNSYVAAIQNLSTLQSQEIVRSTRDISNQFSTSETVLGTLTAVAFLVSVGLALLINRSIARPLQEAINVSKAVSRGDLSTIAISLDGQDELCELLWALKHMHENLGVLVGQVRTGADTIAAAAVEIAEGGVNLSSRTEQQAGSLEETASTMEELTSTVKQNADNARDASHLAVSASEVAVKGGTVVSEVVGMMGSINESSRKIADIISVIDSIAFQTNILALNAAVEAARAGEQGRGFAVVAAEVRNLAQRSAAAAKEIKGLIDDSVNKVEIGSKLVDQAGSTMDEIVASIKKVTDIVGEISVASQEQSSGIEQIGSAIMQLDEMTQKNAQLVEDSLMSTKRLEDQATGLVGVVKSFKLHRDYETTADALVQKNNVSTTKAAKKITQTPRLKAIATPATAAARRPVRVSAAASNDSWEEF